MKKKLSKTLSGALLLLFFTAMTAAMLLHAEQSLALALTGLNLWFQKMIPALLPFMILSGALIGLGLSDCFAAVFAPLLRPLFRLSDSCLYCILIGFLCGFPMGARVCAQSYEKGLISRREATLLLAFCNNIGPIYFTGFVLQLFPMPNARQTAYALFGMYGIPLLYGLALHYTLFACGLRHDEPMPDAAGYPHADASAAGYPRRRSCPVCSLRRKGTAPLFCGTVPLTPGRILAELHSSILSSLDAITVLGGYMIFGSLLNLLPQLLFRDFPHVRSLLAPLLEITSGLAQLSSADWRWAYIVLPFGGFSCFAQTYSCIRSTDLSLKEYGFHKLAQTLLTAGFYGILR